MECETGVLEQWVESATVDRRRVEPLKRIGGDQEESEEAERQGGLRAQGSTKRSVVEPAFQQRNHRSGQGQHHDSAADYGLQAIVRSEVLIGKAEDFEAIVNANPAVARFFWKLIQRQNAIGYEWLVNTGRRDSTARVAHLLCETAERMGIDVRHQSMQNPFTQQQIADITGQTSVNVNRVFADLERQGLIKRKGREIQFLDWNELRRVGSFNPTYLS